MATVLRMGRLGALPLLLGVPLAVALGSDLDQAPIRYAKAPADNAVSRLQQLVTSGAVKLAFDDDHGYLKAVLKALNVPESSQVLVFSKTSLQRDRISPKTPRALYFNDEVYVGFCLRGEVMELAAADPALGTVFYTLDQEPVPAPRFTRQTDNCLICHGSTSNRGFPGHLIRSLYTDQHGQPILSAATFRTEASSPLKERWGGWYVTGTHGRQTHMGNVTVADRRAAEEGRVDAAAGQNVTDLKDLFTTANYLTPHSDLVALLVLEHQTGLHNRLTRATLETRLAMHYQAEVSKALGDPPGKLYDSVVSRIRSASDDLLKGLLCCAEVQLTDPVAGTSDFAREFTARGPRDRRGRSLRDLDLATRLFRYPCSYLIYAEAFDRLPADVREPVLKRLYDVLTGADQDQAFAHLSAADRQAILEILRDTKPGLPAYWQAGGR